MPPAAQDNQGLKIAVAVFATLSVMLAVATYFGFSNAAFFEARESEAKKQADQATQAQRTLQNQFNDLKERSGYAKAEDANVLAALTKDQETYNTQVSEIAGRMEEVFRNFQAAGGNNPQADEFVNQARDAAQSFQAEANRTQASAISRLIDLLSLESQLLAAIAADYQVVRKDLESANQIAQNNVDEISKARDQVYEDHMTEQSKFKEDRDSLLNQLAELQTRNTQQATQIASLTDELGRTREDNDRRFNAAMAQLRSTRERLEQDEKVLERANGRITFVDHSRGEVRTTLTRRQGAREQLVFSVFDRDAAGLPSDSPKATVELIRVDDQGSIGRVVKQIRTTDPIRQGDQLYSPAFGDKQTFALIGKIDIDRNGTDDREDLKRMIRAAGGEVVFDLPPPGAGQKFGELLPTISWYVLDDRTEIFPGSARASGASNEEQVAFDREKTKALTDARLAGIRPISIGRLLDFIGYSFGQPIPGQPEAFNPRASQSLLNPQGRTAVPPPAPATREDDAPGMDDEDPF